jgi:hypothetical protein
MVHVKILLFLKTLIGGKSFCFPLFFKTLFGGQSFYFLLTTFLFDKSEAAEVCLFVVLMACGRGSG